MYYEFLECFATTDLNYLEFWIQFFIPVGIIGAWNFGFKNGPDYSSEVEGKILDTSDNKWKTQEGYDIETARQIEERIEAYRTPMYHEFNHGKSWRNHRHG